MVSGGLVPEEMGIRLWGRVEQTCVSVHGCELPRHFFEMSTLLLYLGFGMVLFDFAFLDGSETFKLARVLVN